MISLWEDWLLQLSLWWLELSYMCRGAQVAWEVTVGLYQMQKKGIRHLDLKSQNILLTDNGHAKIA